MKVSYKRDGNQWLYQVEDLTEPEAIALANAIGCALLPDKRLLEDLQTELLAATLPF